MRISDWSSDVCSSDLVVGAGTVLTAAQAEQAAKAGCVFMVSPGASLGLLTAARDCAVPLLPGAATASEAMTLLEQGYAVQKFFPAESNRKSTRLNSSH